MAIRLDRPARGIETGRLFHARKCAPAAPPGTRAGQMTIAAMPDAAREMSAPQRAMLKLGLRRDIDLALHLPLRYEDETRVTRLTEAREGQTVQVEATVAECRVEFRPRRQLVARLVDDEGEALVLRFLNFYPSQQKTLAAGARLRVRGEIRGGFLGREMVHPVVKPASAALPTTLTPVYPTSAQLPQAYLRKAVASALTRSALHEVLPAGAVPARLPSCAAALHLLHQPPPGTPLAALEDRSHPAWQRLKFDELLAQQLSQLTGAARARAAAGAARWPPCAAGLHERLLAALPFDADSGPAPRDRRDRRRPGRAGNRCTACCRATSARARRWWPRWPRRWPSTAAGNAR